MSGLTEEIERFIKELLEEEGMLELTRKSIAEEFDCAPSQINYVLSTRFPTASGYVVESKRGGGGYIRIVKLEVEEEDALQDWMNIIGDEITPGQTDQVLNQLESEEIISRREKRIMKAALSDRSYRDIEPEKRNRIRATILKKMLPVSVGKEE